MQSFPLLLDPPGTPDQQAIHCPTTNFEPLFKGSVTNPMLTNPSVSECSALTHFSMSLDHKYVNLKEPYNQDIKEQVTTINFLKKKTDFTWNPQPQKHSVQKVFFKFNPLFVVLSFQIIHQ